MALKLAGFAAAGITLAVCFPLASASAGDNNSASLLQSGSNNTLSIDQSNASNSLIGSGNNPFANAGLAGGPLNQIGTGNQATITINGAQTSSGLNDAIGNAFLQQGNFLPTSTGNNATITVDGAGSVGSVTQNGNSNTANLAARAGAQGAILQSGNGNNAGLDVTGVGTNILYKQIGNGLTGAYTITTTSGYPGVPVPAGAPITITQHN